MSYLTFYKQKGKRFFDLGFSVCAFVVFSPLLILTTFLILTTMGKPVLFLQKRPGLNGVPFILYKFRTMINFKDKYGNLLTDKERLTGIGKFLRHSSIDELPELFNVLKGDMSMVGPRPLLLQYLNRYTQQQARRQEVKPGITGWAQVNGRNSITWEEKFKLDVWYVDNISFWIDLKIIFITIYKIISREGVSQQGQTTIKEFKGLRIDAKDDHDRFPGWQFPEIGEGKPNKYNWVVQNVNEFKLGYKTDIGAFTYINAKHGVTIEDFVQIGSHCSIYSISTIDDKQGPVVLKKNCRIGSHSVIMPCVTIGQNAVVGAFSFVNQDIPDDAVAYGIPAKVVRIATLNE